VTESNSLEEPHDFSLVLGGPTYQFFLKSHLAGAALENLYRRVVVLTLLAWLPLLLIATLSPSADIVGRLSFLHDVEVHVRFLIAIPVLVGAELIVHSRIRLVVRRFVERRIVMPQDLPRFDSAIKSAVKLACGSGAIGLRSPRRHGMPCRADDGI
jgi:hypothetical protein